MASPPNDSGGWWDLLHQWKTASISVIGLGVFQGIRMLINDYKDRRHPEGKVDRSDKAEARQWLSQQDRRVRETVTDVNNENSRLRTRNVELDAEVAAREVDVGKERASGMAHYQHSVRLFEIIVELIHDWRNGKPPPDKTPDFDKT
jgi:hypothetical protein